jgi:hypothetical protein
MPAPTDDRLLALPPEAQQAEGAALTVRPASDETPAHRGQPM